METVLTDLVTNEEQGIALMGWQMWYFESNDEIFPTVEELEDYVRTARDHEETPFDFSYLRGKTNFRAVSLQADPPILKYESTSIPRRSDNFIQLVHLVDEDKWYILAANFTVASRHPDYVTLFAVSGWLNVEENIVTQRDSREWVCKGYNPLSTGEFSVGNVLIFNGGVIPLMASRSLFFDTLPKGEEVPRLMADSKMSHSSVLAVFSYLNGSDPFGISSSGKFTVNGRAATSSVMIEIWEMIRYFGIPLDSHFVNTFLTLSINVITEARVQDIIYSIPPVLTSRILIFTPYGSTGMYGSDAEKKYPLSHLPFDHSKIRPLSYPYNTYTKVRAPVVDDFVFVRVSILYYPPPFYFEIIAVDRKVNTPGYRPKALTCLP